MNQEDFTKKNGDLNGFNQDKWWYSGGYNGDLKFR